MHQLALTNHPPSDMKTYLVSSLMQHPAPTPFWLLIMSTFILVWIWKGATSASFFIALSDLDRHYKPNILVLMETQVQSDCDWPHLSKLHFTGKVTLEVVGFTGGIWVIWDNSLSDMSILSCNNQCITLMVNGEIWVDWIFFGNLCFA